MLLRITVARGSVTIDSGIRPGSAEGRKDSSDHPHERDRPPYEQGTPPAFLEFAAFWMVAVDDIAGRRRPRRRSMADTAARHHPCVSQLTSP
ncbi:hypothetical protein [Rhodococcus opacus]|uniref:hypothetical protein n=1 Tax=Rhodococcus opacus TaxID=37919 RepID=UPI0005C25AB0|nr:hypothetical protein [Rhodococcus opacus]